MDPLRCADVVEATGGELRTVSPSTEVSGNVIDSRKVIPGDIFWALPGERTDGHLFAGDAVNRGAKLIVCRADQAESISGPRLVVPDPQVALQQFAAWYRMQQSALVIGVTGSVGKTTTRGLIHAVLSAEYPGVESPASFNNHLGVPLSLLNIEQHHEFAVLELGASHCGEIAALAQIARPEVGVITAIGRAHLDGFGSVVGILRGKGELLEALPSTGFAVLPGDDLITRGMAELAACRVLFVGEEDHNTVRAEQVAVTESGLSFVVDRDRFHVPLVGRHHLTNALIAIAVAREIGLCSEAIQFGFSRYRSTPGRSHLVTIGPWRVIDDTYNASPTAMAAALNLLAELPVANGRRRFAILGEMLELGSATAAEHTAIGELAGELRLDGVLACGDSAGEVARGASRAGIPSGRLVATPQMDVLLMVLDCWLEPGDLLLVKGSRGMSMERVLHWLQQRANDMMCTSYARCA